MKRAPLFLPFLLMLSATAQAAVLVGHWNFEETLGNAVLDLSPFGNNGQLSGATRSVGKDGIGLSFDGTGGVTIPNSPSLDSLPGGFTMSAWIKQTSFSDFQSIFFKTDRITREFLHFQTTTKLHIGINTDPFTWTTPEDVLALNEWQYVSWTFDEAIHRLYVDGNEVFNVPFAQAWTGNDEPLYIGEHPQIANANFIGMIDEPRIYRGVLTRDEILRDMNATGGGVPEPTSFFLLATGLLGFAVRRKQSNS